jgi:hypothetical protein
LSQRCKTERAAEQRILRATILAAVKPKAWTDPQRRTCGGGRAEMALRGASGSAAQQ